MKESPFFVCVFASAQKRSIRLLKFDTGSVRVTTETKLFIRAKFREFQK
ncbi:MAG: hypothetical protein ACI90V_005465 [Bacillariaceae sp.]|jgi:hypothetical protein